ncbi:MAG: DegV family EDD domain-containing protein [Anaerolineae bacterium]|nr:DegV family EDD domain-containing protein [Anaerolineae bacterium]
MQRTAIITDSGIQLGALAERAALPLTILPNQIVTARETFFEVDDRSNEEALALLAKSDSPATLEAPSSDAYSRAFGTLSRDADEIVCICPSRQVLPHWENANRAIRMTPGTCPIRLIDSQLISGGQTLATLAIAEAIAREDHINDIERLARTVAARTYLMIAIDEVEKLRLVEGLGAAHALFSTMLNIKPIISMENGLLHAVAKARNRAQAVDHLLEFATEFIDAAHVLILHDQHSEELVERLQTRLTSSMPAENVSTIVYNPSLAALIGLGAIGIAIMEPIDE